MSSTKQTREFVRPSFIGNFVKFNNCHRYYKISQADDKNSLLHHDTNEYVEAFRSGSIVEKKAGNDFETQLLDKFTSHATDVFDLSEPSLATIAELVPEAVKQSYELNDLDIETTKSGDFTIDGEHASDIDLLPDKDEGFELRETYTEGFLSIVLDNIQTQPVDTEITEPNNISTISPQPKSSRQSDNPVIIYQPTFSGVVGSWRTGGDGDFLFIWVENGDTHIRIVDAKLATKEKPHHQIQATVYAQLISNTVDSELYDTLEAGIVTPDPETHLPLRRQTIPEFELTDRFTDLDQLLRESGSLEKVDEESFEDAPYQLDQKCSGCPYNEACYVDTVESERLEVLGVGQSSQQKLEEENITSLDDITNLMRAHNDVVDDGDFINTTTSKYDKLASFPGIGERITTLIQDAQSLRGEFYPSENHTFGGYDMPLYFDAPPSQLPLVFSSGDYDYSQQEFVQVYLNIQDDHVQDSICGAGALVSHISSGVEESVSVLQDDVTLDRDQAKDNEKQLLSEFASELLSTLKTVVSGVDMSGEKHDNPIIHFYTYTEREKQLLQHALAYHTNPYASRKTTPTGQTSLTQQHKRQSEKKPEPSKSSHPLAVLRDLLGDVKGADQYMISAVRPEINSRYAKKVPTIGLLNVWDRFMPFDYNARVKKSSYGEYTPTDSSRLPAGETTLDVTNGLSFKLFYNYVDYTVDSDRITIHPSGEPNRDGTYAMRVRTASQIPLGYIWAGIGEIDDDWVSQISKENDKELIDIYRYYNKDKRSVAITSEDIEHTMVVMAKLLRHVERGIERKSFVNDPFKDNNGDAE